MPQSTARQLNTYAGSQHIHKSTTKEKSPYLKKELKIFIATLTWMVVLGIIVIGTTIKLSVAQQSYQQTVNELSVMVTNNNNAKQEISELGSQDRLSEIAKKAGLTLNEKNMRNILK